jgi:molecular chaperone GrpE
MSRKLRKPDRDPAREHDPEEADAELGGGEALRAEDLPAPSAEARTSTGEEESGDLHTLVEDLRAKWLRAQADYQNLKRRQLADIDAAMRRAQSGLLENLLLVLDHLDMALAAPVESEESKNLALGVQLTRAQLVSALEREEVLPIPTEGNFDPEVHQAIATIECADAEPGTILEVTRPGWSHRGQVLRPAQVKVAAAADRSDR